MGSPILTAASTLACAHGMPAVPMAVNTRVTASGVPVLCIGGAVDASACHAEPPCIALRLAGSARVRASGRSLAIATVAVADGNGLPAVIVTSQQRVVAA